MVQETIFQSWIFADFILPFLLMFVVVYAVLEKTKILGSDKKSLDAFVALAISLIFIGATYQKDVARNLILFVVVALIFILVVLMMLGFVLGEKGLEVSGWFKYVFIGVVIFCSIIALIWALGIQWPQINTTTDFLFNSGWSSSFWSNVSFVIIIVVVLAVILWKNK